MDLAQQLKDGKISAYIVIPKDFQKDTLAAKTSGQASDDGIQVYYDKSKASSGIVISVIEQAVNALNMGLAGAKDLVSVKTQDVTTSSMNFIDFLLPGIIGMSIMSTSLYGTVGASASNRAKGVFRKLATTPISSIEWNAAKILYQTIVLIITVALCLLVGWLLFGIRVDINLPTILFVIAGSIVFAGLGMFVAGFVKDEEMAMNAANMIGFPLMFLSGSLFPVDSMPWFLQIIAKISPLTYLNEGLRASMITGNSSTILTSMVIVLALAAVFFGIGVLTLKWKED